MNEMIVGYIGSAMMTLRFLYVVIGFGTQIKKNHTDKRFGRSKELFVLGYVTYVLGTIYGVMINDIFILLPYAVGLVFLTVLAYQFFVLKK